MLVRRHAGRRPLFVGLERGLPPGIGAGDERLLRAFRQRYERLVAASARLSLERLCEQVVAEHDYDLAVLAQWDGRRRYANLRKLARLARSYEELRGPDVEGFVRFVREQEAVGAKELEAVAEEEGADAVRLLTIHAAKGLEFKVVVVADASRERSAPSADEIIALSDGRFGFRMVDPVSSGRRSVFDYEEVRAAREAEERAERLRLYYVAMTRAIDRLIVSGAADLAQPGEATPIGWVLGRIDASEELAGAGEAPVELERDDARLLVRLDRHRPGAKSLVLMSTSELEVEEDGQLALFTALPEGPVEVPLPLPPLPSIAAPPLHRVRRLSYSALALFERCSFRYYAERVAGMRAADARLALPGESGLAATEVGDAVHRLLELVDLSAPVPPDLEQVRAWYPGVTEEELARIAGFVEAYCSSPLAARLAALEGAAPERPFAFEHDGVLLRGRLDVLHRDGTRALVLDYKTNALGDTAPEELIEHDYRLQRLVYALVCFRAGAEEVEVVYAFLERPDAVVSTTFTLADLPALEAGLSEAIAAIQAGDFRPTPERVRVRRLPGARRRLCRAPAPDRLMARVVPSPRRAVASGAGATASARSSSGWRPSTPNATIALRFRSDVELLVSVMLSAQTTDVNVNRVTETLFHKYRRPEDYLAVPPGGARARHLPDRLLPPEGEGDPRHDAAPARGLRRQGAAADGGPAAPARRCAQDRERRRGRARRRPGNRGRHARAAPLAAARADEGGRPGQDRARPRPRSCRAPTGTASRTS